ncbi:MAG: ABC transporter ATP-binding protein [Christensenellaceae bacterium]|jgi:ABC-type lipoprotein export system ATPase subunit|nr:ABC transporter ATP-binding protein [Christensenellaceae bacterium]
MLNPLIELKGISKSYGGREILREVSLQINHGDFISIMGQSGAGKSTLLNIMALFERPESGVYYFDNSPIPKKESKVAKLRNEQFGFIFQSFNLLSGLSVEENIAMPLQYASEERKSPGLQYVAILLRKLDIDTLKDEKIDNLSGGEKQRVAIARALVNNPSIIFADEPTGNLDFNSRNSVLKLLQELNTSLNIAIAIVTHDPEVAGITKRKLVIRDGGIYE